MKQKLIIGLLTSGIFLAIYWEIITRLPNLPTFGIGA
jgi:hypothetical protein